MTKLGRSIDELQVERVRLVPGRVERLAKSQNPLLDTDGATSEHEPILGDATVVRETTNGSDFLLGEIVLGGSVVLVLSLAETVDTLVHLGTVMISVLTSTRDRVLDAARMPCTNASNLSETLSCLAGKFSGAPTSGDTLETLTLGNSENINVSVLLEHTVDADLLLKETARPLHLLGNGSTVDLDLHEVGLLLSDVQVANTSVGDDTDSGAILLDAVELTLQVLGVGGVALVVLGESLLLGSVPVLVESAQALVADEVSPNGGQGTETLRSVDVSNDTNNNHRRALNNGHSLAGLAVVPHLASRHMNLTENVSHTGLVAHERGEVGLLTGIVLGEGPHATTVVSGTLPGQKTQGAVAGGFKLSVRHADSSDLLYRWGKREKEKEDEICVRFFVLDFSQIERKNNHFVTFPHGSDFVLNNFAPLSLNREMGLFNPPSFRIPFTRLTDALLISNQGHFFFARIRTKRSMSCSRK